MDDKKLVNEDKNIGDAVVDQKTEQAEPLIACDDLRGPIRDPFFDNTVKLPPRKELEAQLEKWKRRALAFQEGYRDKSFEVTALEIQLMDLRAHGVDKVTASINERLKTKMLAACIQRNEAKEALAVSRELLTDVINSRASERFSTIGLSRIQSHIAEIDALLKGQRA